MNGKGFQNHSLAALGCAAGLLVGAGTADAEIVYDLLSSNPASFTIAQIQGDPDGSFRVGDKVFSDFVVTTTGTIGVTAPDENTISVRGTDNFAGEAGVLGIQFFGGWATSVGQSINTTIEYTVTADDPFQIDSVGLLLRAFATAGDGLIQISENVTLPGDPVNQVVLPPLLVQDPTIPGLVTNFDEGDINASGIVQSIRVIKDITVRDGEVGGPGIAHLSSFSQGYRQSVIPEPTSLLLVGASLGAIVMRRRRRG